MKKSRFTDSQIIDTLKRAEAGLAVPDLCRELGISSATFYKWRARYGGMDISLMARMKELEAENSQFSSRSLGTRENSRALSVMSIAPCARLRRWCLTAIVRYSYTVTTNTR